MRDRNTNTSKSKKTVNKKVIEKLIFNRPFHIAEAYKRLRTNINHISSRESCKKIIITSSLPNEGKSIISINLAAELAKNGARVVLVDCDMRSPYLANYLNIDGDTQGLSDVLLGTEKLQNCIKACKEFQFAIITTRIVETNPSELLSSRRMAGVLEALEKNFDYVICDTAPVCVVSDAMALSEHCDGVILVVRQNVGRLRVREAKEHLDNVNANVIGVVMNDWNRAKEQLSYYYYKY